MRNTVTYPASDFLSKKMMKEYLIDEKCTVTYSIHSNHPTSKRVVNENGEWFGVELIEDGRYKYGYKPVFVL